MSDLPIERLMKFSRDVKAARAAPEAVRCGDLLSESRRIVIDLGGGGTMTLRCHGQPTPEFLRAMKAMGEAAARMMECDDCSDSTDYTTNG